MFPPARSGLVAWDDAVPGMEGPRNDPHEVLHVGNDGKTAIYAKYRK